MFKLSIGDLYVRLLGDASAFNKMMDGAERKMLAASKKMESVGKKLFTKVTLPLVGIGGASVKAFSDFDDAMTKSVAIMGGVSDEMRKKMEDTAKEISSKTTTSAKELAEAYYFLASAGMDAEQAIAALAAVEKFSIAGAFDMAKATDLLTDAQSTLGLASKNPAENLKNMRYVSDQLVGIASTANASVEQFSKAIVTKSGPALKYLGKSLEEGLAVLGVFADRSYKAEQGGEKLAIVLRDVRTAARNNAEAWAALGIRAFDANEKMLPVADIVEDLDNLFSGLTDQQKGAAQALLGFQDRSFDALATLLGTSQAIREYHKQLLGMAGKTEEVARVQLSSFNAQMVQVWNNVVLVGMSIGKILAPYVLKMGKLVQEATLWWFGLSSSTQEMIIALAAFFALIGPVLMVLSGAVKLFGLLYLKTIAWTGAIAVTVGAIALLTDVILRMTDSGNLGLIELVNNFRIGGDKISTRVKVAWLEIFKGFEWMRIHTTAGWEAIAYHAMNAMGWLYRGVMKVLQKITYAFGFDEIAESAQKGIDESLKNREARTLKFIGRIGSLYRENANLQQQYNQAIAESYAADEREFLKTQKKKKATELTIPEVKLPEIPGAAAPMGFGMPEIPGFGMPSIPMLGAGTSGRPQEFEQISLRRFGLSGPGGLSTKPPKQEVEAKGVEDRMDTLIDVVKNKQSVAVLG